MTNRQEGLTLDEIIELGRTSGELINEIPDGQECNPGLTTLAGQGLKDAYEQMVGVELVPPEA